MATDLKGTWITLKISSEMTAWAKTFGEDLATPEKPLTTTQLRRFFGEVRRIQADFGNPENMDAVLMLEPKLAYAVGRSDGGKIKEFHKQLSIALRIVCASIDAVNNNDENSLNIAKKQFDNFVMIMEAIVAYHKSHEAVINSQKNRNNK